MNVSSALVKDYENKPRLRAPDKQTQFYPPKQQRRRANPILSAEASAKADSKGTPVLLCGALLRTGTFEIATAFGLAMTKNGFRIKCGMTKANRARGL